MNNVFIPIVQIRLFWTFFKFSADSVVELNSLILNSDWFCKCLSSLSAATIKGHQSDIFVFLREVNKKKSMILFDVYMICQCAINEIFLSTNRDHDLQSLYAIQQFNTLINICV